MDISPDSVANLSDLVGNELTMHEIRISYDEPATDRFIYTAIGGSAAKVVFRRNGVVFIRE